MSPQSTAIRPETTTRSEHGIAPKAIHANLNAPALVERAVQRGEGSLTEDGAFVAVTSPHTGRSPKDKFVVEEAGSSGRIALRSWLACGIGP